MLRSARTTITTTQRCFCWLPALTAAAALLTAVAAGPAQAGEYHFQEPGPTGLLRVTSPTVTWKIWPGKDMRVTRVALTLNGQSITGVRYSDAERAVVYRSEQALPAGDYRVVCRVTFNDQFPVTRDWQFTVSPDAARSLPAPGPEQEAALNIANQYRRTLGLPDFQLDARLCAAAAAHSRYMARNREVGHEQQAGRDGFIAAKSWERLAAFGYAGGSYEDVEYGSPTTAAAIRGLFDAPYHRIPFLQPGAPLFGAGFAGLSTTLNFGTTNEEATVVHPADRQNGVPTSWDGNETPNPLRVHSGRTGGGHVGYPITFAHFAPAAGKSAIVVTGATLEAADTGERVPFYLNTPENDSFLRYAALLIPHKPLRAGATYRVSVTARAENGANIGRVWQFTTAGVSRVPAATLASAAAAGSNSVHVEAAPKL